MGTLPGTASCITSPLQPTNYSMTNEAKLKESSAAAVSGAATPLDKLRAFCLSQGYSGILSLGKLFRRLDKDRSWTLSREELEAGVKQFGLDLTDADIKQLFAQFEKDGKSGIDYEEFLEALRPGMSDARKAVVMQAFSKLDKSGDGIVTTDDLKGVYTAKDHPRVKSGDATEDQILKQFLARFEGNTSTDGKVTKQEFLDYYAALSKAVDDDVYFVEMIKLMWAL